ncbi:MAG: hypothetical protein JST84_33415 [Acidobacteria bacterium]|nr:hypothetical protein [Acidobacteriota bacterium]
MFQSNHQSKVYLRALRVLRGLFLFLAVLSVAFAVATLRMRAQGTPTVSPSPTASASPTASPSIKPSFSLSTNRTYGSNDRAKIYVHYQGIDALDFRIYKVKDPAKFFKQLNDPHQMGEADFQTNETVSEVKDSKPGTLEKIHDFKASIWTTVKNYFRKQLNHESRVEFNVKFRGLGGERDRLPLNTADYARVPLLNQDQLVTSFRQRLATDNKYDSRMVIMDKRDPGVYLVEAVNSQTGKDLRAYTVAIVTDLTMVYKTTDEGEMLVYTVDRKTGEPHGGMGIEIIKGKQTVVKGTADNNGVMRAKVSKPKAANPDAEPDEEEADAGQNATLIMAMSKDQFAISDLDAYYLFDQFEGEGGERGNLTGYIYTDRPVYRPNQKVYFKGILRKLGDNGYENAGSTAHVTIEDPNGGKLLEKDLPLSPRGTFNGEAELAEEAALGNYSIVAQIGDAESRHYFDVEEYKKPEYKVTVTAPKKFVNVGEKTNFTIEAKYFFGAPVANAEVKYYIYRSRYYHPWWRSSEDADDFISESDEDEGEDGYGYGNDMVKDGEAKLGKDGKLNIEFEVPQPEEKNSNDFTYRLEAMVTDSSRREIEGKGSFVGVRGNVVAFATSDRYVYYQGDNAKIKVKTADYEGKPVSAKVTLRFVKREWDRIENPKSEGKWDRYEYKLRETEAGKGEVNTNAQGEAEYSYNAQTIGDIDIQTIINDNGKQITSHGGYLWVTDRNNGWPEYASANQTAIKLIADKKSYRPGETAKILATLPTEGAHLLVTTELENIKTVRTIKSTGRAAMIEVPIDAKYVPNVYLSVCYVKEGEFYEQSKLIAVPAKDKFLNLEIIPNKKEFKPRETASYTILARNNDGSPAPGTEVSLGVVDEAVYSIRPENAGDMRREFYGRRYNRVNTSFSTQFTFSGYSGDKPLQIAQNKRAFQLADFKNETQYAEPTIRKEFKDTAFWNANIVTGADGKATVNVPLPDNLTTWRATARAVTADLRVGSSVGKVLSRKDLILRLETPRFLTEGDTVTLSGIVHNYLDSDKSTKVEIEVTGAELLNGASQTVTIPKQGDHRVDWQIKANSIGQVKLLAKALTDTESDAIELPLNVQPAGLKQTRGKALALSGETDEQVFDANLPANAHAEARKLRLEASPSVAGTLFGALDYLTSYPYGCTEQTMSSFLPNVYVAQALQNIKSASVGSGSNLASKVNRGLKRLYGFQHDDGGWGWWKDDKSDPFMTAYVVDGLTQATRAGYGVESYRISNGREALKKMIESHKAEDGKPIDPESHAYMVYAFVISGEKGDNYLNDLFNQRNTLQPYGRALLALALKERNDKRADQVASDLERSAASDDVSAHWNSTRRPMLDFTEENNLEASALAVKALARINPGSAVLPKAARWLVQNRNYGAYWNSTKQTAFAIYGLTDYLKASQELTPDYTVEIYVNGEQVHTRRITSAQDQSFILERKGSSVVGNNQIRIVKRGRGVLYFGSTLDYYTREESVAAQSSPNLQLTREYFRLKVDEAASKWSLEPLTGDLKSGDYIVSKLKLTGAKGRQVMIEDPIPAGCEQMRSVSGIELDYTDGKWSDWYSAREFRDNRTVLFVDYFDGDATFQYAMRVQIPGQFKIGPARAEFMYQTNVNAHTTSDKKTIVDKK